MLYPIRQELGFGEEIYESLDEAEIDVTVERVDAARRQNLPFDHFSIVANTVTKTTPEAQTDPIKEATLVSEPEKNVQMVEEVSNTSEGFSLRVPAPRSSDNLAI